MFYRKLLIIALALGIALQLGLSASAGEDKDAPSDEAMKHFAKARDALSEMAQIKDKNSSKYKKLYGTAARELEAAVKAEPDKVDYKYYLALLYYQGGDFAKCIGVINEYMGKDTDKVEFLELKAKSYVGLGRYSEAEKVFKKMMEIDAKRKESVLRDLVKVYSMWKKWDKLIEVCGQLLEIRFDPEIQCTLGNAYLLQKKYKEAVEALEKLLEKDPYHASGLICISDAYGKLKMYDKAIEACEKFLKKHSQHDKAKYVKSNLRTYRKMKKDQEKKKE